MKKIVYFIKSKISHFKTLLSAWWYNLSSYTNNAILGHFLWQIAALLAALLILLGICGCSTIKYVPIESSVEVIQKDSVIRITDTITIEVPKEVIKEVVPADTVSILKTSNAESEARLEKGKLHHRLEQKGTLKAKIDTCYITQIVEKTVYQDRPIEVPKEVKHIPSFFWWSLILNIVGVLFLAFRIYLKLRL